MVRFAHAISCGFTLSLLLTAACGGASQAIRTPTTPGAAQPAALPALPSDPLLLVPTGVRMLGSARIDQLRASPHFATVRRWAERFVCIDPHASQWLFERTERVVLAAFDDPSRAGAFQAIVVARGDYQPGDAGKALELALTAAGRPAPAKEQRRGRFVVFSTPEYSAVQLDEHSIAAGNAAQIRALLDVADGKHPNWLAGDALMAGLDSQKWLEDHNLALIAKLDERSARQLGRSLENIGGDGLSDGLAHGSAAIALVLTRDAHAQAQLLYADGGIASSAAAKIRSLIGGASLIARLMGLPPVLDRAEVDAKGPVLELSLRLSADEVQQLREQVEPLLRDNAPACSQSGAKG